MWSRAQKKDYWFLSTQYLENFIIKSLMSSPQLLMHLSFTSTILNSSFQSSFWTRLTMFMSFLNQLLPPLKTWRIQYLFIWLMWTQELFKVFIFGILLARLDRILPSCRYLHLIHGNEIASHSLYYWILQGLVGKEAWRVQFPVNTQRIEMISRKRQGEKVHSQGRVLGDRSVLYKYLNPNLFALATTSYDSIAKCELSFCCNEWLLCLCSQLLRDSFIHKVLFA